MRCCPRLLCLTMFRAEDRTPTTEMATLHNQQNSTADTRPLSDIYEATEPSLLVTLPQISGGHGCKPTTTSTRPRIDVSDAVKERLTPTPIRHQTALFPIAATPSEYSSTPSDAFNVYRIPASSVPQRSSSHRQRCNQASTASKVTTRCHKTDVNSRVSQPPSPAGNLPAISNTMLAETKAEPNTGVSASYSQAPAPLEILDNPSYKHPRVKLSLHLHAPIFVGGSSLKGTLGVLIDRNIKAHRRRRLDMVGARVDLLGYEEVHTRDRAVFFALGSSLIRPGCPPRRTGMSMATPQKQESVDWTIGATQSSFPFSLNLPFKTGPPAFHSRHIAINFVVGATVTLREDSKYSRVRLSKQVQIIPAYSFNAALQPLRCPIVVRDGHDFVHNSQHEMLALTISLIRHTWISGGSLSVDVHISNWTSKQVKAFTIKLEQHTLLHKAARVPEKDTELAEPVLIRKRHQRVVAKKKMCNGFHGWHGAVPHSSVRETYRLDLPKSAVTVPRGRLFEVAYVLIVVVTVSQRHRSSVEVPVTLVQLESLSTVAPNTTAPQNQGRPVCFQEFGKEARVDSNVDNERSHSMDSRLTPSRNHSVLGRKFHRSNRQSLDETRDRKRGLIELHNRVETPSLNPKRILPRVTTERRKLASQSLNNLRIKAIGSSDDHMIACWRTHTTPPENEHDYNCATCPKRNREQGRPKADSVQSRRITREPFRNRSPIVHILRSKASRCRQRKDSTRNQSATSSTSAATKDRSETGLPAVSDLIKGYGTDSWEIGSGGNKAAGQQSFSQALRNLEQVRSKHQGDLMEDDQADPGWI